ncbi:MAG TPA: DUF899 family protein [Candidatus Tumulicola sp.]|nr:DUF899 family protein [Candidatus Tumulicola sp.]
MMAQAISVRDAIPVMPGASDAYKKAREELFRAEDALREQIGTVAAKRRTLPAGPEVQDYAFMAGERRVRLSELFSRGSELIVYHLMYWADDDEFCPMCSMWIDGLNGVAKHVDQRANIVVATRAPVEKLQAWAKRRGWDSIRLLSDDGPTFARDTGAEDANGDPVETVLVFSKDGPAIRNTYVSHAFMFGQFGGIDLLSPVWHLFDLLPSGRDDWSPSNDYA